MKNLKVEKNVAVFEAFYPLNLSLFDVKRGFNCSIPFYKIYGYKRYAPNIIIKKNKVRAQGQGHSDLKMVYDTLSSQYTSTLPTLNNVRDMLRTSLF